MYVRTKALLALSYKYVYIRQIVCLLFFTCWHIAQWVSVNLTKSTTSFPHVIRHIDATRWTQHACTELKNMCTHPYIRLGHGSKDTTYICLGTSFIQWAKHFPIIYLQSSIMEITQTDYSISGILFICINVCCIWVG